MAKRRRNQNIIGAYLLIGLGIYFLAHQFNIPVLSTISTWPGLLMILGISILIDSQVKNDNEKLFAAMLLFLFGLHFHFVQLFSQWHDHWSVYLFIIGLSLLIRYIKTRSHLSSGLILTALGFFFMISQGNTALKRFIETYVGEIEQFWPIGLIAIGIYMLFGNRK